MRERSRETEVERVSAPATLRAARAEQPRGGGVPHHGRVPGEQILPAGPVSSAMPAEPPRPSPPPPSLAVACPAPSPGSPRRPAGPIRGGARSAHGARGTRGGSAWDGGRLGGGGGGVAGGVGETGASSGMGISWAHGVARPKASPPRSLSARGVWDPKPCMAMRSPGRRPARRGGEARMTRFKRRWLSGLVLEPVEDARRCRRWAALRATW